MGLTHETIDFSIKPGVLIDISAPSNGPSTEGVFLHYPRFRAAYTFSRGEYRAVFYPDEIESYVYGEEMPYVGELTLIALSPFVYFSPQDINGTKLQFDCRSKYLDSNFSVYQLFRPKTDEPAEYSWDNPGGISWSYFPKTPDNCLPNNPDVHVEVEFSSFYQSRFVHKEDIRLSGVQADNDINSQNDHTAYFNFPIPECGPMDLQVEYQLPLQNGQTRWYPLNTNFFTSASNGDLVGETGRIDVFDVAEMSNCYNTYPGDLKYNPCANYFPDPEGYIGFVDLSIFSSIYWWGDGEKDLPSGFFNVTIDGEICQVDDLEECSGFFINSEVSWDAATIQFNLPGVGSEDVVWVPSETFVDRSVWTKVPGSLDDYGLVMLGPVASGRTPIGQILVSGNKSQNFFEIVGSDFHFHSDSPSGPNSDPSEIKTQVLSVSPNPFNPSTNISLFIDNPGSAELAVYSIDGRLVKVLKKGMFESGEHNLVWEGVDERGQRVPSGSYFYLFSSPDGVQSTGKMTLLK
jgi:hypothetical protein